MATTFYHVSSSELSSLAAAWINKSKPVDYTFDGFVLKMSDDESGVLFHPLYRNTHDGKAVIFNSPLTAEPCPNPPGYSQPPINSWHDIDPTWPE